MIRRLLLATTLLPSLAWGQSVEPPGFFIGNNYSPTGTWTFSIAPTFNNGLTSFNGSVASNRTVTDPSAENVSIQSITLENLTANNANDVLSVQGQMAVNSKAFHSTAQHAAGVYGHSYGFGDNAGGVIDVIPGVVGMAGNQGIGTVAVAASFLSHIPDTLAGGTVTNHYVLYDQGCTPVTNATACHGAFLQHDIQVQMAGTAISYFLMKQDATTTIGSLDRPNNRNAIQLSGYDSVILNAAVTAPGMVEIAGGATTIASGACGTTTNGTVSGNNNVGLITIGAATTTACAVSFSGTVPAAPKACVFSPATSASAATTHLPWISAISTTGFTLSGAVLASTSYYYHCI